MQLHYTILGHGPQPLVAFHGIGQTGADCFESFAQRTAERYTIYAFDLPFHGKSPALPEEHTLQPEELTDCIESFLEKHQIKRFSLLGFSIGGRFAVTVGARMADRVDELLLIAPDGIYPHFLYRIATGNTLTRAIFRGIMRYPSLLLTPATELARLGLYPTSVPKLLHRLLDTEAKRHQVYRSWVAFRYLQLRPSQWQPLLSTPVFIFLAQYDFLVPARDFATYTNWAPQASCVIFPVGHFSLLPLVATYLLKEN